jgi:hypothetical protein
MRDRECAVELADRDDAIGIDNLPEAFVAPGDRTNHRWMKENWEIVGHDHRGAGGKLVQQSILIASLELDVRVVGRGYLFHVPGMLRHSIQDELMEPIASPSISTPKRFQYHQRLTQVQRPIHGSLKRKVVGQSSVR